MADTNVKWFEPVKIWQIVKSIGCVQGFVMFVLMFSNKEGFQRNAIIAVSISLSECVSYLKSAIPVSTFILFEIKIEQFQMLPNFMFQLKINKLSYT